MSVARNEQGAPKGALITQGVVHHGGVDGTKRSRGIIYLRVSTIEQAEKGLGLKVQLEACRAAAEAAGVEVVGVESDEGVSGTEGLDARRGLVTVIDALHQEIADVLIVYRLDRLARDVILQETLLQQVWTAGAEILSCSAQETELARPDDGEDPARTLVRQILAAVAAYERSMIRLRMRGGKRRVMREKVFAGGSVTYGWEPDKSTRIGLREVWVEQAVLQHAARLHDVDGFSWADVAAQLNAEGALRPRGKGQRWTDQAIRRAVAADRLVRERAVEKRAV